MLRKNLFLDGQMLFDVQFVKKLAVVEVVNLSTDKYSLPAYFNTFGR